MFNYLRTTFRDSTPIPLPTEKRVEAPSGDVAADEPPSTKDLPKQKNGSAFEAHASGDEMRDELGKSCTKPNELSVEPPSEERLEDEPTKARSDDEAEAAVGAAQQVLSRSIEVEVHVPDVPSELHMARSELQEQPSSRDGEPLESEHPDVLNGMVEVPNEVEDVDRAAELASEAAGRARRVDTSNEIAQEDQPSKLCNGSTNDLPGARRLLFEGEQAMCTSDGPRNPNSIEDEQPRLVDLQKEPSESTMPWRQVGIGDIDAPTPQNVPIEAPSFKNQDITLGRLASPNDEGHVASGVEGKKAGGIGEPTHGKDDTKNSGNVGSERIEAGLLAGDSQDAYRGQNERGDSPMSSRPPTRLRKHPYEAIRPRRRRGRIKFEAGNVSRKRKCKNVYRGRGNTTSHAREGIGTSHSLTIKPRMQEKCQRHVRHDARSVEALQSTKSAHSELKALHGETAVPDDLQGPKECPEDIRNQQCVDTNPSSRIEGLGGQEEANETFGVVEDEPKFQNDEEHVGMEGEWCLMDGATSSTSRDSKRVETRLLAGDESSGQHEQQKHKPNDVPGPPSPLGIHLRRPTKPVIQPRRRRRLKSQSI
ncbi:hypothetical protein EDD15DRAFT_2471328 [Pisolithus albus]|nr:hypothetical protein EDD15DRAFT_2471328 [Pisolithus albus]